MYVINGVVLVGRKRFVRIDKIDADTPQQTDGLTFLTNPAILVADKEIAETVVKLLNAPPV